MNGLIGDLDDVASLDAGRLQVRATRLDVGVVLAGAVETFARSTTRKGVDLHYESGTRPIAATPHGPFAPWRTALVDY